MHTLRWGWWSQAASSSAISSNRAARDPRVPAVSSRTRSGVAARAPGAATASARGSRASRVLARPAARPLARAAPAWTTTPAAPMAAALARVAETTSRDRSRDSGPSPAAARSARNRWSPAGSTGGGAQPRALDTNTWSDSQPTALALPGARPRPPATDTWAPMRTSEQVEQEPDAAAALGLLAGGRALLDHPAPHREHEVGLQPGLAQPLLGLLLGQPHHPRHHHQVGALADPQDHRRPQGHLGPADGLGAHRPALGHVVVEGPLGPDLEVGGRQLGLGDLGPTSGHLGHRDLWPAGSG